MHVARALAPWLLLVPLTAQAKSTVIARASDERGGVWAACGGIHAVRWVVYDLVAVVEGDSPGPRFVGIHSCPGERLCPCGKGA